MLEFINNFYVLRLLFIIIFVLMSMSIIDLMKKRYSINIKDKLVFKKINLNFLLKMATLSFVLRIFIEQTIYFLPIEETVSNMEINFFTVLVEIITTCLFAPICEEIICRFGIYEYLNKKIKSFIITMILTSLTFSLVYFYGIDGVIIIFVISLIWNYAYYKTNNLVYSIILHFLHNVYAMIGYTELNNIVYILFGVVCLLIYIFLKIKDSSKNTTAS